MSLKEKNAFVFTNLEQWYKSTPGSCFALGFPRKEHISKSYEVIVNKNRNVQCYNCVFAESVTFAKTGHPSCQNYQILQPFLGDWNKLSSYSCQHTPTDISQRVGTIYSTCQYNQTSKLMAGRQRYWDIVQQCSNSQ